MVCAGMAVRFLTQRDIDLSFTLCLSAVLRLPEICGPGY